MKISLPNPEFSVLDVTLRDGGLANGFAWTEDRASLVCRYLAASGIEWIEPGYVGGLSSATGWYEGVCADLQPDFISSLASVVGRCRLSAVFNPSRCRYEPEWDSLAQAGLKMVRVPTNEKTWARDRLVVERVKESAPSLLLSVNVTNIASYDLVSLEGLFHGIAAAPVDAVFATDTTSQLLPSRMSEIVDLMKQSFPAHTILGYHGHDSLGCATANLIEGTRHGIELVDSSLLGYGRGGGNLRTELIQVWRQLSTDAAAVDPEAIIALFHAIRSVVDQVGGRSHGVILAILYAILGLPQERLEEPCDDEVAAIRDALALGGRQLPNPAKE